MPDATAPPRAALTAVARELQPAFTDAELLAWLTEPNPWLGHRAPLNLLPRGLDEVLQAARADRFVLRG